MAGALKDFSLQSNDVATNSITLSQHLTLRNICIDYREAGGSRWIRAAPPESSGAESIDQVPCMNRFENIVGHACKNEIVCFRLMECTSLFTLGSDVMHCLDAAFASGRLWAVPSTVRYKMSGRDEHPWMEGSNYVPEKDVAVLNRIAQHSRTPLSFNTVHAATEADYWRNVVTYANMFRYPHNAARGVGIISELHDNQCVDMSPGEEAKQPNPQMRLYKPDFIGFICAGHTSHSTEAGRVRRLTCDTRLRLLKRDNIQVLSDICEQVHHSDGTRDWLVFCMGVYCYTTEAESRMLCSRHRLLSLLGPTAFSVHIQLHSKTIIISVSSGTVLKKCSNGVWADSIEVWHSDRLGASIRPVISQKGPDQIRACFSGYFSLIPYISSNRAPRPLISSVQTPQAVCMPWCTGDAAVSPCYSFKPLVTTPMYSEIMKESDNNMSCLLPGENVMCLFLNLENNYEDAIIVSKRYIQNGGFSTVSMVKYILSSSETIPPVGATLCGILYRWWKSPCQPGCSHTSETLLRGDRYTIGYVPSGIVHSITDLASGDICVKIRSHQCLQDGDKLSMGHGQKGVAVITDYEDMPIACDCTGAQIVPDIVMAMASVVTRQTNGVLYECAKSLQVLDSGSRIPDVVVNGNRSDVSKEFFVKSGATGTYYNTLVYSDDGQVLKQRTKASMGMVRVFNQTQMTRERHHVSHLSVSKRTLRTPGGRSRGGGVTWGEMEVQASSSGGLQCCNEEITSRGDLIVAPYCSACQRLGLLCTCHTEDNHISVKFPYDLITLDTINAIVYNGSYVYNVEPET